MSNHSLHMWLGLPIIIRLFLDEYDPSGRVFFSPQARSLCCGIIAAAVLVTYFQNPARRLAMDEGAENSNNLIRKKPSFLAQLAGSAANTINSSSSSMFRNALFVSILFWFGWPQNNSTLSYAVAGANNVCDPEDTQCRIANHYGPGICCIQPSFCDAKSHNWIYQQGGTAQAYKPDSPFTKTICDPEQVREQNMRHKVATWPYWRSSRRNPPQIKVKLNLLQCNNHHENPYRDPEAIEGEGQTPSPSTKDCCCYPLIGAGSGENATIEIWQTRPDGTYSSLRAGNEEGDCRAQWTAIGSPDMDPILDPPSTIEFQTMAPGSSGVMSGLGPGGWEFYPYGPPVVHILVRPGMDGVSPLLVDVPVSMHPKTLEQRPFSWRDWRGPAWVKSKGNPDQPAFNVTSWEADVDNHVVSMTVDLYLQEDKDYSVSYTTATSKLMCPSLFYGLPSSFFLEPISVCGRYLLDYFDL